MEISGDGLLFNHIAGWMAMLIVSPKKALSNHSATAEAGEERV